MNQKSSQPPAPAQAQNLTAQLIFKQGRKEPLVGYLNDRVVLAPVELKLEKGIYYNCKLRTMKDGKGYVVLSADKTESIRASLSFKKAEGEKKDWGTGLVGSYNSKIVIVPDGIKVLEGESYDCEIVLKPIGNAYHVQKAVLPAPPVPQEAIVEANGYPVMIVEVRLDGKINTGLRFDATSDELPIMHKIVARMSDMPIKNREAVIEEFKSACIRITNEHKKRIYAQNAKRF